MNRLQYHMTIQRSCVLRAFYRSFFCVLIFCTAILTSCGKNNGTKPGDTNQTNTENEATSDKTAKEFFDLYSNSATMTKDFAFIPAVNGGGARYFDAASGVDVLFCFDPNCQHLGPRYDLYSGENMGDNCVAYQLGYCAFSLREDGGYFFRWPEMIHTDREGKNRKVIATVDEPIDFQHYEVFTKEQYFTECTICYDHIKQTAEDGTVQWLLGDRLEEQIAQVLRVSLTDGSSEVIFRDAEHHDAAVVNLYVYDNHLYFEDCYLDIPFAEMEMTKDDGSDWEEVARRNSVHYYVDAYDYNIATGELRQLFQTGGENCMSFYFGPGVILGVPSEYKEGEHNGVLYDMNGELIRTLPWVVSDMIITDGNPIFTYWHDGVQHVWEYDVAKDTILREVDYKDGEGFRLRVAIGTSYYGGVMSQDGSLSIGYIRADDYWNGKYENAVIFHQGREGQ